MSALSVGKKVDSVVGPTILVLLVVLFVPMLWGGSLSEIGDILSAQLDVIGMALQRWTAPITVF